MKPRRRLSLLPYTAAANALALLVLFSTAHRVPVTSPEANPATDAPDLVAPASSGDTPPDRVTIAKQTVHHVPGRIIGPPPMPRPPWPWMTPLPEPKAGWVDVSVPADPLRDALDVALRTGEGWLSEGTRTVHVVLPRAGQAWPGSTGSVVVVAADEQAPSPTDGWTTLADDDRLWRQPHDVRAWRRTSGCGAARLKADQPALWLPAEVRAGWLARRPEALRLLRNLLADDRLR